MLFTRILAAKRVFFGLLILVAAIVQAVSLHQSGTFNPVNYLSYFTNLSNIFAALVLLISAAYLLRSRRPSRIDDIIRGAAVLYMSVTGVVYVLLLRNIEVSLQLAWVNVLMHYIAPVVVLADWMIRPPGRSLRANAIGWWLLFPAAYLAYTLIRGATSGWYPYPFLNPAHTNGYDGVALYSLGILIAFSVIGSLLIKLSNRLKR